VLCCLLLLYDGGFFEHFHGIKPSGVSTRPFSHQENLTVSYENENEMFDIKSVTHVTQFRDVNNNRDREISVLEIAQSEKKDLKHYRKKLTCVRRVTEKH